jgi:hypothetical protein
MIIISATQDLFCLEKIGNFDEKALIFGGFFLFLLDKGWDCLL